MLQIADNQQQKALSEFGCTQQDVDNLMKIANVSVRELQKEHPNLLVFPDNWNEYHDEVDRGKICEIHEGKISTTNIMGFVGINGTKLSITSRFTPGKNDFFLHYMLMKVLSLNVLDLKHSFDTDSGFDFLIYLFPRFLQRALHQGIFKKYIRREYNDCRLKGCIDFPRHIKRNIPFNGKIAYSTREYSYDNEMTQLIRHTIEYIQGNRFAGNILSSSKEIRDAVAAIQMVTPTFNKQQRQRIIAENLRPFLHPYFSEYKTLQKLCLAILRHEELKYGRQKDEVYGVLFDGAWLWEEYLNTILSKVGFEHAENKTGRNGIKPFGEKNARWYPDFYKANEIVLDAKYKRMPEEKIERDDLFQIISYLHVLNAEETGVIHPSIGTQCKKVDIGTLNGLGGDVFAVPYPIPQGAENMQDFVNRIMAVEAKTKDCLSSVEGR